MEGTYPLTIKTAETKTHNTAIKTVMITAIKSENKITVRITSGESAYDADDYSTIKSVYATKTFWTDAMRISNDAGKPMSFDPFDPSKDLYAAHKVNKSGSVHFITENARKPMTISYTFRTEGDSAYNPAEKAFTVKIKNNFSQKGARFEVLAKRDHKSFHVESLSINPYAEKYRICYRKAGTKAWKTKSFTQTKLLGDKWWKKTTYGEIDRVPAVTGLAKNATYEVFMTYCKNGKWYDYRTKEGKRKVKKVDLSKEVIVHYL